MEGVREKAVNWARSSGPWWYIIFVGAKGTERFLVSDRQVSISLLTKKYN